MKALTLIALFAVLLKPVSISAQKDNAVDTLQANSKTLSEANLIFQQRIVDSLVKEKIQSDLQLSAGDRFKTRDLAKKLKEINEKDSLSKIELLNKINELKKSAKGYPVAPFSDTLLLIFNKSASSNAAERAQNITNRILKLYDDPFFKPDSVQIIQTENGAEITYFNDLLIMVVTKVDALLLDKDEKQLAVEYRKKIVGSIMAERKANSFINWLIRIGQVILIFGGLWFFIFIIKKAFSKLNLYLVKNRETIIHKVALDKFTIFSAEHFEKFLLRVSSLFRLALTILIIYLSLPLLFSVFPETQMWTTTLLEWVLSPAKQALNGVINFLPNLFSIIVIVVIFRYGIRGIKYFVDQIESGGITINGFYSDWAQPTFRILKFLLYAFMMVLVFPYLPGSDSLAFRGVSVFIGVLFSLGSSSAISNIIAGLVITYMRPFKKGDRVKIGEITGDVLEKTLLVTRIRTPKNEDITVPNSTVLSSSTTNYTSNTVKGAKGLIVHTTVTIGYDVPWKNIHQALIDAALRTDLIQKTPVPFVLQTSLDDFYVSYQLNAYTKSPGNMAGIYSDIHRNIQDCCNEAGIEILSPHYRNQRDGNMITIPANYLEKDYTAPAFNVKQVKEQ